MSKAYKLLQKVTDQLTKDSVVIREVTRSITHCLTFIILDLMFHMHWRSCLLPIPLELVWLNLARFDLNWSKLAHLDQPTCLVRTTRYKKRKKIKKHFSFSPAGSCMSLGFKLMLLNLFKSFWMTPVKVYGSNLLSKDALREEGTPWLTKKTSEYKLTNVKHFKTLPHVWHYWPNTWTKRGESPTEEREKAQQLEVIGWLW